MNELDVLLEPVEAVRSALSDCDNYDWDNTMRLALKHRKDYLDKLAADRINPGSIWRSRFKDACRAARCEAVFDEDGCLRGVRRKP